MRWEHIGAVVGLLGVACGSSVEAPAPSEPRPSEAGIACAAPDPAARFDYLLDAPFVDAASPSCATSPFSFCADGRFEAQCAVVEITETSTSVSVNLDCEPGVNHDGGPAAVTFESDSLQGREVTLAGEAAQLVVDAWPSGHHQAGGRWFSLAEAGAERPALVVSERGRLRHASPVDYTFLESPCSETCDASGCQQRFALDFGRGHVALDGSTTLAEGYLVVVDELFAVDCLNCAVASRVAWVALPAS